MHTRVKNYITKLKTIFPDYFENKSVLDVGSLDINGTVRDFFVNCKYTGLDIIAGKGVDIIQDIKDHDKHYDIVISTEMLEHNKTRDLALKNMYKLADKMLIVTCANINRKEHGTNRTNPKDSPATTDYYRNISKEDILGILPEANINEDKDKQDIMFYILKK